MMIAPEHFDRGAMNTNPRYSVSGASRSTKVGGGQRRIIWEILAKSRAALTLAELTENCSALNYEKTFITDFVPSD
jgi:hypothetical protein